MMRFWGGGAYFWFGGRDLGFDSGEVDEAGCYFYGALGGQGRGDVGEVRVGAGVDVDAVHVYVWDAGFEDLVVPCCVSGLAAEDEG